jgi:hypothetical protein
MPGIGWLSYLLFGVGFSVIAFALFAPGRDAEAEDTDEDDVPEATGKGNSEPRPLTWPRLVDGSDVELPREARMRLIESLGSLGERWCGPILTAAYLEEDDASLREAALGALRVARYTDCEDVLAAAMHSPAQSERILAVELADVIDATAVLDSALDDPELTVAAAAVYALDKRFDGSLATYLEQRVSPGRARELLDAIHVLL